MKILLHTESTKIIQFVNIIFMEFQKKEYYIETD